MRARLRLIVVVAAAATLAAGLVLLDRSAALSARTSATPALLFIQIDPLIVRGLGFGATSG